MSEDPLETAWAKVEQQWDDDAAHKAFVGLCLSLDRLAEAGRRYRQVRDDDPERRDEASRRIDALLALALQTMELTKTEAPDAASTRRKITWVAFGIMLTLIAVAVMGLLRSL